MVTFRVKTEPDPTCPACGGVAERRYGVPLVKSDTTFYRGVKYGGGQFRDADRHVYTLPAQAAGVSTNGKHYQHGLARFPGDPEAWVDNLGDVKRILEKRGWGSDELGVKSRDDYEPVSKPIDERLVTAEVQHRVAAGEIDPNDVGKKREEVRDEITPHWHK